MDLTKTTIFIMIYLISRGDGLGKSKRSDKEYTREQRLSKENRQLKRELMHLRKQISRLDLEGLESAKQACFDQEERERLNESSGDSGANIERLKDIWACNSCNKWLEITLYSKCGQTWYFRKCTGCEKRTKGQRYDEKSVKGILKNE